MTKTPASNTVKEVPGYPVQNSPSGNYFWGGPAGRGGIVYDIVWRRCPRRTPWMMLPTPVCSYPIIVSHLSFNFLCLLLLYSIYLNGLDCIEHRGVFFHGRSQMLSFLSSSMGLIKFSWNKPLPETYIKREVTRHDCLAVPAQLSRRRRKMKWNIVQWGKK